MDRFSCEDAVILVLEEFPDSSTAFIESRVQFHKRYILMVLRKLEDRGVIVSRKHYYSTNRRKDGYSWNLPNNPHPTRASKKWSLADDGKGRPSEDQG